MSACNVNTLGSEGSGVAAIGSLEVPKLKVEPGVLENCYCRLPDIWQDASCVFLGNGCH